MEISEILGGQIAAANANSEAAPAEQLGREDFLTMLIAQLENQDPLDPQDASEFTAQLAQFSSLDQLVSMRQAIDGLAASSRTADGLAAASLIGQHALVESQNVSIGPEGSPPSSVALELPGEAQILSVELVNAERQRVAIAAPIGLLSAGVHELSWSAFEPMPGPGMYSIRVNAAEGARPTTLVRSEVTGAVLDGSDTALQLGQVEVPIASLREIGMQPVREI